MNARIKSLIDQATVWQGMENGYIFDKEKFAELIVRECLLKIEDERYELPDFIVDSVKQHFGVSE